MKKTKAIIVIAVLMVYGCSICQSVFRCSAAAIGANYRDADKSR